MRYKEFFNVRKSNRINKTLSILAAFISFLVVGSVLYAATTIGDNINTGGTLDVTGLSTFSRATSTSATTTDYLYVGSDFTAPPGLDYSGDLFVFDDLVVNSQSTSTVSLWVGSGGTADIINVAGGDLYVQNDGEIDGNLFVGGTSSTTAKIVLGAGQTADATSTIILGDEIAESATCIKLRTTAGDWVYAYATSSSATVALGLTWTTTSCE
ncbi:MAG: hypothetical protein COT81_04580 [Candidatus Buchananbacteria bacterium CG10_big_fil_rev_8_21_14_0_10_42_9]|uniref:Uncharacterized protein n=1 Tax=Candidatus Buchananbacteria bacterium CG10_big_fil_rev_8_21_14_0_10_42_9 TaxID=1974526 RepID=A0A2H0W093_9BACT|nr:MAG: hypothetical protein COT81_04580 [Candidatus Buchananbacteria bacterium CG10_big_fil_rev_8_21_14_0_10_42_9]